MGKCAYCGLEIFIAPNEDVCPNCSKNPYICWNCNKPINLNLSECPVCHFYECENCGVCGPDCKKSMIVNDIKGLNERQTVEYIFEYLNGKVMRDCPRCVSISYAKNSLANLELKRQGYKTTETDANAYKILLDKIISYKPGESFIISDIKENGTHGFEIRETANMAVCLGYLSKERKINDSGDEYDCYTRIEKPERCSSCNIDNIHVNKKCPKCNDIYGVDSIFCDRCVKRDKSPVKLLWVKSKVEFCNLDRTKFVKHKKKQVVQNDDRGIKETE